MFIKFSFMVIVCFLFLEIHLITADEVPAILWNIRGDSLEIKPVPALERDDWTFNENIENILNNNANVLVFSVNKLSSEDFSADEKGSNSTISHLQDYLDSKPYVYMSSIRDPLTRLHNVHCGVQEIVVDQSIDENILQSVSRAFGRSCVVILHISDSGVFGVQPEQNKNVFLPSLPDISKNVVGVFTAEKSSWTGVDPDHHFSRNLFEVDEAAPADPNFVNLTCVYLYMTNASVQYKNESALLTVPPSTEGSSCGNETVVLQLTFKPSGNVFTSVVVNFQFKIKMGSWVTETTISVSGDKAPLPEGNLPTTSDFVEAPLRYSFNCGNLRLKTRNETNVVVTMNNFQVQPFPDKGAFSESFDCVSFFTVPIWMGVFVTLLFIVIINVGIYALFSVHTMDRFDDPKGKTISVAVGSE